MILPQFHSPHFLWLLLLIPALYFIQRFQQKQRKASIKYSNISLLTKIPSSRALKLRNSIQLLRYLFLAALIVALARPQIGETLEEVSSEGVDIILTLDISTSMKTMDFKPKNRLVVAKKVIEDFVVGRKSDRIGLVVFAAKSFTQCPLTLDYGILVQFLRRVDFGMVDDGTAIGTAILTGTNRLKNSKAKSKVMILLTDGENNAGEVDPITAAQAAKAMGIKMYTIGIGKSGEQPIEIEDEFFGKRIVSVETKIDEKLLKEMAKITGGQYYRAQNPKALQEIYQTIDKLEKTEIQTQQFTRYTEYFTYVLLIGLGLLFIEVFLSHTRFMKIP